MKIHIILRSSLLLCIALMQCAPGRAQTTTPTFAPAAGTYKSAQLVTIADTTAGATIYYTSDGSEPTATSMKYAAPVAVPSTMNLQAIAVVGGSTSTAATAAYSIPAPPTFSPASGSYNSAQAVTLSDAAAGAIIHYTTDGTAPTTGSATYGAPIAVSSTETVRAIAV